MTDTVHTPRANTPQTNTPQTAATRGFRRKISGRVIKAKMQKTVVVECVGHRSDPLYGKYIRTRAHYHAHDEKAEYAVGDLVEIQEHSPMSRHKRFVVTRLIKKFVEG